MSMPAGCSSSSERSHTSEDYRTAALVTTSGEVYQDTYTGDDDYVVSADSNLTFPDGSSELNNIQLHYDGEIANQPGYCVFSIDDDRNSAQGKLDDPKLVQRCDGKVAATFLLGDISASITGHPMNDDGMSVFHIDSISVPRVLTYYRGHSPSADDNHENDDHGE